MIRQAVSMAVLLTGLCGLMTVSAQPVWPQADRLATVDARGVLRWRDDASEVALFGVNYYAPFWHNYPDLKAVGADHKKVIDEDLAHLARLGLDALRLHVFDREVSDRAGSLLDNEHLMLLDYLIAQAKARGIYTVLTPIAWWPVPGDSPGFSTRFTMQQMTTDAEARRLQTNYLAQFLRHVNRFTGQRYVDDPAVVAFELINEPLYPEGTPDAQVTAYINALADAMRNEGCRKPVFYNGWLRRLGCVAAARVDGSSFGWYPNGLASGRSQTRNFLRGVNEYGGNNPWNPSMRTPVLEAKAKIVYEFDAADIPGSYIYPAMARSFRSGGAQIATQFQYDPLPLAPFNQGWQTHYLSLQCAPQKAVSFLIAGEAFRRLPRLHDYGPYPQSCRFGPFRVSYEEDLSEMVTEQEFFHSNTTRTRPPAPDQLRRIAGCGSSPLIDCEGTGAYFLERLAPGLWRLEVYPDAVWVNDPYGPHRLDREVCRVLWREWPMVIRLPDLGTTFSAEPLNKGNAHRVRARDGRLAIRPGIFLLRRNGVSDASWQNARLAAAVGLREFVALPSKDAPPVVRHEPVRHWIEGRPLPLTFTVAAASEPDAVSLRLARTNPPSVGAQSLPLVRERAYRYAGQVPGDLLQAGPTRYSLEVSIGGTVLSFPTNLAGGAGSWEVMVDPSNAPVRLFNAAENKVAITGGVPHRQALVGGMENGARALRVGVEKFGPPPSALSFHREVAEDLEPWRERLAQGDTLCVRARALEASTTALEVVLQEQDGSCWGTNVPLSRQWQDIRVPLASLRHFSHWAGNPPQRGRPGDHFRPGQTAAVSVCFGAWLYPADPARPHTIEVEQITIETGVEPSGPNRNAVQQQSRGT